MKHHTPSHGQRRRGRGDEDKKEADECAVLVILHISTKMSTFKNPHTFTTYFLSCTISLNSYSNGIQEMQNIVELLGKSVSFIATTKVEKKIFIREEKGVVTDVILNLNGSHQISLDDGEFHTVSELLEFQIA